MNKKYSISEKTKKKIQTAIVELDYKPSTIARNLVRGWSNNIGIVVQDITNLFQVEIIRSIEEYKVVNKLDYNILIIDMGIQENMDNNYLDILLENRVTGIATTYNKINIKYLELLKKSGIQIIFVASMTDISDFETNYVIVDNYKGAFDMTNYLLSLGHRKIAYFTGPLNTSIILSRLKGYKEAMVKSNVKSIEPNIIILDEDTHESIFNETQKSLSSSNRPTAIFCDKDNHALEVLDYCYKNNIKIPEDLSLAGFDDMNFSSFGFINLTTVRQPVKEFGIVVAKLLFKRTTDDNEKLVQIVLDPEIIVRGSTRAI